MMGWCDDDVDEGEGDVKYESRLSSWWVGAKGFNSLSPGDAMWVWLNLVIVGSGNGLAPIQHQGITWANVEYHKLNPIIIN